jgi:hypothetical protein
MNIRSTVQVLMWGLVCLPALVVAVASSAQDAASVAVTAKQLLADNQTDAAIELLENARERLPTRELAFLRGVAYQQRAMRATDRAAQEAAARQAEQAYREATDEARPVAGGGGGARAQAGTQPAEKSASQAAAAHNNLAAMYAAIGDHAKASDNYERAIASNDARKGYYALNYARYLEPRDVAKSIEMARVAAQAAPQNADARDYLGSLLWQNRIDAMLPYASELTRDGHNQSAADWAIRCLRTASRPAPEKTAWLVLLAQNAAATIRYSQPGPELREAIAALRADPEIGRGANELGEILFSTRANADVLGWWRSNTTIASLETTPRDTMRGLLRATADALLEDGDVGNDRTAERYLTAAIEMGTRGPDPENFLRLVEVYANADAYEQLAVLMDRYEGDLFSEKSDAYARGDWPLIYRMHLALGMTYAHIDVWESSQAFRNAFFQLDAAQRAAEQLNERALREGRPERAALPPAAVTKLAEGYQRLNRSDQSLRIRVEGAENLQKAGFIPESAQVLSDIPADQLQRAAPAVKTQIDRLNSVAVQPR